MKKFSVADLPNDMVEQVRQIEQALSQRVGDDVVLIAYQEEKENPLD